jgi:molybdopterin synthase sulfur carrier subunit
MAVTFYIAGFLTQFAEGTSEITLEKAPPTMAGALDALWKRHEGLRDRILTERGEIRPHVNIFVEFNNIRDLSGLATPLRDGNEICILPSVSGG